MPSKPIILRGFQPHPLLKVLKDAGLTIDHITEFVGSSYSTCWATLNGRREPTPKQATKFEELREAIEAGNFQIK